MPKFVITGASGGGKSTLIAALAASGYRTLPEAGRLIVAEQLALAGTALPWRDRVAFMELLFERSIAAFDQIGDAVSENVFLDRSFIEAIGYCAVIGHPVPEAMLQAAVALRFDPPVFVCPPWPEIFAPDTERRHDFKFARRDYEANIAAYSSAGYDLIDVPRVPVADRVAFVEQTLANLAALKPFNPAQKG